MTQRAVPNRSWRKRRGDDGFRVTLSPGDALRIEEGGEGVGGLGFRFRVDGLGFMLKISGDLVNKDMIGAMSPITGP